MQTREHIFKNLHMNKYDLISLVMHSSVDYDNKYVFVQLACKTNFNNLKTLRVNTWGKVYFMNISHFWIHIHMEIVQLCCLYLSKVAQWHQTYVFPCKFLIITPYKYRDFFYSCLNDGIVKTNSNIRCYASLCHFRVRIFTIISHYVK